MRNKKLSLLLAAILLLSCVCARLQEPFRLHIIANSDGAADQNVKLLVRDAILEYTADEASACRDKEQAEHYMREHLSELEACANQVLAENGFSYTASATVPVPGQDIRRHYLSGRAVRCAEAGAGRGRRAELVVRHVSAAVHCK